MQFKLLFLNWGVGVSLHCMSDCSCSSWWWFVCPLVFLWESELTAQYRAGVAAVWTFLTFVTYACGQLLLQTSSSRLVSAPETDQHKTSPARIN